MAFTPKIDRSNSIAELRDKAENSPVGRSIDGLADTLARVEASVARLVSRLDSVLISDEQPACKDYPLADSSSIPLCSAIDQLTVRLEDAVERKLADIHSRLGV